MRAFFYTKICNFYRLTVVLLIGLILCCIFYSCQNSNRFIVLFDQEFDYVQNLAKKKNKVLAVILARPDCPACQRYIQSLHDLHWDARSRVMFHVVDVSLPENRWYVQWLALEAMPTTTLFSPQGELKAVVPGSTRSGAMHCIQASIDGDTRCAEYFHTRIFPSTMSLIPLLNTLLSVKKDLEKEKDISEQLKALLTQSQHPYAIYLKAINEAQQGRHESAAAWANRFLSTLQTSPHFILMYGTLIEQARIIIDPNHTPENEGRLTVTNRLSLGEFEFQESHTFSLMLINTGLSPLLIQDIILDCTCLDFGSDTERQYILQPGQ